VFQETCARLAEIWRRADPNLQRSVASVCGTRSPVRDDVAARTDLDGATGSS
jgi:hypothetical protein